jgi:hypothetical protein
VGRRAFCASAGAISFDRFCLNSCASYRGSFSDDLTPNNNHLNSEVDFGLRTTSDDAFEFGNTEISLNLYLSGSGSTLQANFSPQVRISDLYLPSPGVFDPFIGVETALSLRNSYEASSAGLETCPLRQNQITRHLSDVLGPSFDFSLRDVAPTLLRKSAVFTSTRPSSTIFASIYCCRFFIDVHKLH